MTAAREQIFAYIKENLEIDDTEVVNELITEYCLTVKESLGKILTSLEESDGEGLYRAAHSLKGCSGNVGHQAIHELCLKLETAARDKDFAVAAEIHAQLQQIIAEM
jgi:HPt (histidine-containing phosphotransfer) domain-containing protein